MHEGDNSHRRINVTQSYFRPFPLLTWITQRDSFIILTAPNKREISDGGLQSQICIFYNWRSLYASTRISLSPQGKSTGSWAKLKYLFHWVDLTHFGMISKTCQIWAKVSKRKNTKAFLPSNITLIPEVSMTHNTSHTPAPVGFINFNYAFSHPSAFYLKI